MKSAGKARNNGLYRHIRTSKEIIRNLLNDCYNTISCGCQRWILYGLLHDDNNALAIILPQEYNCNEEVV